MMKRREKDGEMGRDMINQGEEKRKGCKAEVGRSGR